MNSKPTGHQTAAGCRRALCVALVLLACAVVGGCVHRRFTVRTNPPGARLYVDDYEIGTTPVSHDFIYYGTRKIRLVKDGYETLTILQPMPTPWYDLPGIDFFTENLVPYEFKDHRVLDYQMQPQVIVPTEQVLLHADELRRTKNPAVPGAMPPGAAPGTAAPAGAPPGGIPSTFPPGTPPSGSLPPGTPPLGTVPPSAGSSSGVPQYVAPPGTAPQFGVPQYGAPPYSAPPGGAAPGSPAAGVPTLPTSPPAWPTTPPPSATVPPATSGPPSNYRPPGY